jgi:hypothetical protein
LVPGDKAPFPDVRGDLDQGGNKVVTDQTGTERTQAESLAPETAI